MSKIPREKDENSENNEFHNLLDADEVGGEAYGGFLVPTERSIDPDVMQKVVAQTLNFEEAFCSICDDFCAHSMLKSRDLIITRALKLNKKLTKQLEVYQTLRKVNVEQCDDLLKRMYATWRDLTYLYEVAEYQSGFDDDDNEAEFEEADE